MEEVKMAINGEETPVSYKSVTRKEGYGSQNFAISLIFALLLVIVNVFVIIAFSFNGLESFLLIITSVIAFVVVVLFLNSYSDRESRKVVRVFERKQGMPVEPVTMYMPKGNDRAIAEEIMNEIGKSGIKPEAVEIPHYDYIGSSQTRTYHLRSCRLAKLIKPKFKLSNNSPLFFKKRKFKSCKICIRKLRKA